MLSRAPTWIGWIVAIVPLVFVACTRGSRPSPDADVPSPAVDPHDRQPVTRPGALARADALPGLDAGMLPKTTSADGAAERADQCLADPRCEASEAGRLYEAADDAGATRADCFRFYYGSAVAKDLRRARLCLERRVSAEQSPRGSSPTLERSVLALMWIEGQGGSPDGKHAMQLLAGTFADMDVQDLRGRAQHAPPANAPEIDFCRDVASTTQSLLGCAGVDRERAETDQRLVDKTLVRRLDAAGQALYARGARSFGEFLTKDMALWGDRFRGGSLSPVESASHGTELVRQRAMRLRGATTLPAALETAEQAHRADAELNATYRAVLSSASDEASRKLLRDAQLAWIRYRDDEMAVWRSLFPQAGEAIDAHATTYLTEDRTAALKALAEHP